MAAKQVRFLYKKYICRYLLFVIIVVWHVCLIANFGHSLSMRSVPNSPPLLPSNVSSPLPLQDSLDLFPPLPAVYPASYINTPPQQHRHQQQQQQQQQQHAHDDEAISYSNRLRKSIDLMSRQQQHNETAAGVLSKRERQGTGQSLPPHPSPTPTTSVAHRPRSASVSRKPLHSLPVTVATTTLGTRSPATTTCPPPVPPVHVSEGNTQNLSHCQSSVPPQDEKPEDNTKKHFPRSLSDAKEKDIGIISLQTESAYIPQSYAAYAQSMFNYGGISGIPTPLTREILSFVERVDDFGAKMQKYVRNLTIVVITTPIFFPFIRFCLRLCLHLQ